MTALAPPTSGVARGLRLGRAAFEVATQSVLGRIGLGGAEGGGDRSGRALMSAMFELRGAALKVAQFLSLESDLLPESVARELAGACHQVPPMGPAFARDAVHGQIGPVDRLFTSFAATPFAGASLGQVHAATTLDGQDVAVKIQYPGMPETIRADMRLLRRTAGLLPHRAHYQRLVSEVETRLLEECDYLQETQSLLWFRERISVEGVTVADVLPALSASRVLTTLRQPGVHLDTWLLSAPSQQLLDLAGQRLYDVFVHSLHVLGRLHADPNPGNILFSTEGEICLLDFGCTRWIPPDCQDLITRVWRAAVARNDVSAHSVYRDMGLFGHLSEKEAWLIDDASLRPFREWLAIPFLTERFDFAAQPDFVAEGRRRFMQTLRIEALVGIRSEFVLVNRTLYGLYRIFERLGARVRCQTKWTAA